MKLAAQLDHPIIMRRWREGILLRHPLAELALPPETSSRDEQAAVFAWSW